MSHMTSNLATSLSDAIHIDPLISRLSDPHHIPLVNRLELCDQMEVEGPSTVYPLLMDNPNLTAISKRMATAGSLVLDPVYDYPQMFQDDQEEEDSDQTEETGYKKTKQGR